MQVEAKVLENRHVRMEPLAERHKEDLRAACAADPATWRDLYIVSGARNGPSETCGTLWRTRADVAGLPLPVARVKV